MPTPPELRAIAEGVGESLEIAVRNLDAFSSTKNNKRVAKVLLTAALAKSVRELAVDAYGKYKYYRTWTVKIDEFDPLYDFMVNWAATQDAPTNRKSVTAAMPRRGENTGKLLVYHDRDHDSVVKTTLNGHRVELYFAKDNVQAQTGGKNSGQLDAFASYGGAGAMSMKPASVLHVRAYSKEGRDAVIELLGSLTQESVYETGIYMPTSWGEWRRKDDAPKRDFSTVILQGELQEDLIRDLEHFYECEEEYQRIGAPWHRGYLFHGPPGTGKTSIAKALATEFDLDLYYLPLVDVKDEDNLVGLLSSLRPRSVLLIEDIDVAHASRDRDGSTDGEGGDNKGVTLSGLLNALDGVVTPHGLVTIMTTNKLELLDPALIRPGRADRVIHVTEPDQDQLDRLIETFVLNPEDRAYVKARDGLSMADVIEVIKQHLYDKTGLREALEGLNG